MGSEERTKKKFDKERRIYVFAETLRPIILSNKDQICHLPSLTYYALSTPRYIYYEVENAQGNIGWNMLYNMDEEIKHPVVSITRVREMYGESIDQFPYITALIKPSELTSPYWVEREEEVTDEHLVTLGKHQQKFLGNLKLKNEKEFEPVREAPETREEGPKPQELKSPSPNQDNREDLITSLVRSNRHLADDVAFLKRRVHEMTSKYYEVYSCTQENPKNINKTLAG